MLWATKAWAWTRSLGIPIDADANVILLDSAAPEGMRHYAAFGEDLLLLLDPNHEPSIGNASHAFTHSRTDVTAFGAFVDLGVHQDGLVHTSQLANRFVKDPSEVIQVGDHITVRVLAIDPHRRRISLTAKALEKRDPGVRSSS
jgi:polyribonucleotide nucleotidyltransferase